MRKRILALGLAVMMIVLMAGCSKGKDNAQTDSESSKPETTAVSESPKDTEAETAGGSQEKVTLRFMWWGSDVRHEATIAVIQQYEALHPNVTIEAEYGGYDGYFEKLTTQLSGGTAADIIQYNANSITDLMAIGDVFADLSEYADVLDTSGFDEGFLKNFSYYDGRMMAGQYRFARRGRHQHGGY